MINKEIKTKIEEYLDLAMDIVSNDDGLQLLPSSAQNTIVVEIVKIIQREQHHLSLKGKIEE